MRRLLAPAFLTTVSLASACTKKPVDDGNTHNPPAQLDPDADAPRHRTYNPPAIPPDAAPTPEATASTTATPEKPTKKRKRTAAANSNNNGGSGPPDWSSLKNVNPKDSKGRAILAMHDDRCAVQVPFKGPMPTNMPTGFSPRSYEYLDCPSEMDDAAYDDCTYLLSVDTASASGGALTCYCMPDGGNPPPPPRKQKCPANAKDVAKKP